MTETYLIAGTASHVGKSTVAAGLCRLLADRGVDVAPFKAQNMSNNARAVPRATAVEAADRRDASEGTGGEPAFGEIGVSQYVQARAARVRPTTDCNPVLLKPQGDAESQLVIDGRAVADVGAREFYEDGGWERARSAAEAAYRRLAAEYDVIVAEGAGAIAEPNLRERDLANVETARFADATILLVADVERGGAFASVVGTAALLPEDLRDRLGGILLTKFRGDASLLADAIEVVEERLDVPVLGVLPYDDPELPAEDSVDLPADTERGLRGADDGIAADRAATVAVPRLPRISNFTDLEPLAATPGLRVSYRPLDDHYGDADAIVLPGTKNAVDDLLAAREAGLDDELRTFDGPIVGLCGGYQLLGRRITNAALEGTGDRDVVEGFGLLPVETQFEREKVVRRSTLRLDGAGPLADATGSVTGYEIHQGRTRAVETCTTPFAPLECCRGSASESGRAGTEPIDAGEDVTASDARDDTAASDARDDTAASDARDDYAASGAAPARVTGRDGRAGAAVGACRGDVLGTYLHGLFENEVARRAFANAVVESSDGAERPPSAGETAPPCDRAAALLADHADLQPLLGDLPCEDAR